MTIDINFFCFSKAVYFMFWNVAELKMTWQPESHVIVFTKWSVKSQEKSLASVEQT